MAKVMQVDLKRWFDEFNMRYFGGRLSKWRVELGFPPDEYDVGMPLGYCDRREKTLYVACMEMFEEEAQETLIHEMVHASGILWHGKRFRRELKRLKKKGAPVSDLDLKKREILKGDEVQELIVDIMINDSLSIKEAQKSVAYALGFKSRKKLINRYPRSSQIDTETEDRINTIIWERVRQQFPELGLSDSPWGTEYNTEL